LISILTASTGLSIKCVSVNLEMTVVTCNYFNPSSALFVLARFSVGINKFYFEFLKKKYIEIPN